MRRIFLWGTTFFLAASSNYGAEKKKKSKTPEPTETTSESPDHEIESDVISGTKKTELGGLLDRSKLSDDYEFIKPRTQWRNEIRNSTNYINNSTNREKE